jgi:hypothetical protein
VLVLYSDGVTEAENMSGVAFDEGGLQIVIGQHWWQDLNTLGTAVLRAVEAHAAGAKIADDLTVLAVRRPVPLPPSTGVSPNHRSAHDDPGTSNRPRVMVPGPSSVGCKVVAAPRRRCRTRFVPRLRRVAAALVLLCSVAARGHVSFAQVQPNAVLTDGVAQLLLKIEAAVGAGSASDFLALSTLSPDDPNVRAFLDRWLVARTTRATVRERDRAPLDGGGVRLMAEALIEAGAEGRLATWTLEMAPAGDGTWRLTKATTSGMVDGLFHLELDPARAFRAHDLVVLAEDFELRLPAGDVFVAMAGGRISAAILMGAAR